MKTSYIVTVFNEEKTIESHLLSVLGQTILPSEIIIVDAGSKDKTIEEIEKLRKKIVAKKITLTILVKKGNRSIGRNTAIKHAKYPVIACSDSGCILDKKWLENITQPFIDSKIDVVSGFYKPLVKNIFQKAVAAYTCTMPDKVNSKSFLPSSRSIAFRKKAWKKAKGYPENLDTCEDLVFDKRLQQSGASFVFQKNAFVWWPQRGNLFQAAKQFFSYAKGDGKAHFFRKTTPFLYIRYILAFFLTFAAFSYHIRPLILTLICIFMLYLAWAVYKNYTYVKNILGLLFLPTLQLTSDITVLSGTTVGFIESLRVKKFLIQHIWSILLILGYSIVVISGIDWGIPNNNHPFNYHMDEWAQAQSIRAIFRHGTPNISGASHGSILFYFLGGIYLIPFILLHIVNPFIIKNSLQHIAEQHTLFEVLRTNTLLWGIGSISLVMYIANKYLNANAILSGLLFAISPVFLILSGYYKYDIGLIFCILLSLLFTFRYSKNPSLKNFLLLGFINALTIAVKISAIPLVGTYLVAFFLFTPKWKSKFFYIPLGLVLLTFSFCLFGIPDLFLGIGDYGEWFHANLVSGPNETPNYNIHESYLLYLFRVVYPLDFGKVFFPVFILTFVYWITKSIRNFAKRRPINTYILYLLISAVFFFASLLSLKLSGNRNRLLVLLPFFTLLTAACLHALFQKGKILKKIAITIAIFVIFSQSLESAAWVSLRILPHPQEVSSQWILSHVPKNSTIGLIDVPIFENIPDILLKEYYSQIYLIPGKTNYTYTIVDKNTKVLPKYVVLTNVIASEDIWKKSDTKDLVERLQKEKYKLAAQFTPDTRFFHYFSTLDEYYFGNIAAPTDVSIYLK